MAKITAVDPPLSESVGARCAPVDSSAPIVAGHSWFVGLAKKVATATGMWGFVDQALVSVTSFLATAAVGRLAGSDQLGVYSLAVSIFWLVAGIPNALVWTPYTSRAPRLTTERRRFYAGSGVVHLLVVVAVIAVVLLTVGLLPLPGLSDGDWFFPMCVALVPFTLLMMLREHLRRLLFAHLNTKGLLAVDLPIAVAQFTVLALLAQSGRLSYTTALLGMALPCTWCLVWLVRHRRRFRFDARRVRLHWDYNFQFGRWLLVVSIAWLLGDVLFRWLLGSLHGLSTLGQFAAAMTTVMFINPILLAVQNLARSASSNSFALGGPLGGIEALRKTTVKTGAQVAVAFGALLLTLAVFGGPLVEILFGSEFVGLGSVVACLCLGMYVHTLTIPVEAALAALEDGRAMLMASIVRLGLIVAVGVPLIALYGGVGVGLTMAVSSGGAAATEWIAFRKRCRDGS